MASLCSTKVHIAWCISILPSKLQSKSKLQEWRGKEEWWCNGAWEWFVRISVLFAIVIRRKKNCTREELTTRTNWAWISPFFSSHLVASYQSSAAAELCLATISAYSELKTLILFMWDCGSFINQHGKKSKYRKVTSSNTSRLEAHASFFWLLMKGIFDSYKLRPSDKKLIS